MGRARPRRDDVEPLDGVREDMGLHGEVNDYRRREPGHCAMSPPGTTGRSISPGTASRSASPPARSPRTSFRARRGADLGRVFTAAEDVPNGPRVVVLGHGLWQRRYGGDPAIVGRTIQINGAAVQVVGVMPPEFVAADGLPESAADAAVDAVAARIRRARTTAITAVRRGEAGARRDGRAGAPTSCTASRRR